MLGWAAQAAHLSKTWDHQAMTKSELVQALSGRQAHLVPADVEMAVKSLVDQMADALADGQRIEVRGFGSFSLHFRPPRMGRNPKTGDVVALAGKYVPHFKPGKELRERVNAATEAAATTTATRSLAP
jgi:integration host factor subunit beta